MQYELITAPIIEPFTLSDLKEALRIDHDTDDDLVGRLGKTARRLVERRLSHAIAEQTWQASTTLPSPLPLPLRPGKVNSVSAVELQYGDQAFEPSTDWTLLRGPLSCLELTAPTSVGSYTLSHIRITFLAGRSDLSTTPPELVQAILMLAAHYYEHREAVLQGRYVSLPASVEAILAVHREMQL